MHLGNGAITPECAVLAWGAAAGGLAVAGRAACQAGISRQKLELAAALGCLTFAAQAVNVPLAPGFSGHLVGGVLLAWLLGPGLAAGTMSLVLLLQALVLGDGGLLSLGANVVNMALLPAALVSVLRLKAECRASHAYVGVASGLAVLLAAALIVGETALFRPAGELAGWGGFAARMIASHLWIGAFEAAASLGILWAVDALRYRTAVVRPAIAAIACAMLLAAALLPISSGLPDGYEAAAEASGIGWLLK